MQYNNLTQLLSDSADSRAYFMNLPVDIQLELHKYNDSVRTNRELRDLVESLNKGNRFDAAEGFPHEYSLY